MTRAILLLSIALPLAACGSEPSVSEQNASVEDVSERVREASREQGLIRPGKWMSTVSIEDVSLPGMPADTAERMRSMLSQTRSVESCLTPEQARQPNANFFSGNDQCRYDTFTMTGGKIDAVMRCEHQGTTQVMEMEGTYSPTSYEMHMRSVTEGGPGGETMTMQMKVAAERVGECESEQG